MPNSADGLLDEPHFSSTSCLCPKSQQGFHDDGCISSHNKPIKPNPRAGKRAWREYNRKMTVWKVKHNGF